MQPLAGIGCVLSSTCVVQSLKEDGPAMFCGLIAVGDQLLAIDGSSVASDVQARSLILGPVGTQVCLSLERNHTKYALARVSQQLCTHIHIRAGSLWLWFGAEQILQQALAKAKESNRKLQALRPPCHMVGRRPLTGSDTPTTSTTTRNKRTGLFRLCRLQPQPPLYRTLQPVSTYHPLFMGRFPAARCSLPSALPPTVFVLLFRGHRLLSSCSSRRPSMVCPPACRASACLTKLRCHRVSLTPLFLQLAKLLLAP